SLWPRPAQSSPAARQPLCLRRVLVTDRQPQDATLPPPASPLLARLRRQRGTRLPAPRSPRLRRRRGHSLTCPLPPRLVFHASPYGRTQVSDHARQAVLL